MSMQKLFAYLYILGGFALIFIFGGKLLVQIVGIVLGLMLIKQGFSMLSTPVMFRAHFTNFKNDKFQ